MSQKKNGKETYNYDTGRKIMPVKNGSEVEVYTTDVEDSVRCEAVIKTRIVPVIFLPGIMGTNLKKVSDAKDGKGNLVQDAEFKKNGLWQLDISSIMKQNGSGDISNTTQQITKAKEVIKHANKDLTTEKVWTVKKAINAVSYVCKDPSDRQKLLNPETTTVDYNPNYTKGPGIFSNDPNIDLATALMRGWGSVSEEFYWGILKKLQLALNTMPNDTSVEEAYNQLMLWSLESKEKREVKADNKATINAYQEQTQWDDLFEEDNQGYPKAIEANDQPPKIHTNKQPIEDSKSLEEMAEHAAYYRYEVFAVGYNWLNSNMVSANGGGRVTEQQGIVNYNGDDCLHNVVDNILKNIQEHHDADCNKVIFVTHSMGGLVARAYATQHADKVLGVVHGVMPATGAATMYKRMRAGFGGTEARGVLQGFPIVSWIFDALGAAALGNNVYKTDAIMTHSVGVLELAPSNSYGCPKDIAGLVKWGYQNKDYQSWLQVIQDGKPLMSLPQKLNEFTDPYEEIYKSDHWYGLLPRYQPDVVVEDKGIEGNLRIDPAGIFNYKDGDEGKLLPDIQYFYKNVEMASIFHLEQMTHTSYHPQTYASCTIDHSPSLQAFGRIRLVIKETAEETKDYDLSRLFSGQWILENDNGKGEWVLNNKDKKEQKLHVKIITKDDAGDETVPGISAIAPAKSDNVKELWQISDSEHNHGVSWNADNAHKFALYAVLKIMQEETYYEHKNS